MANYMFYSFLILSHLRNFFRNTLLESNLTNVWLDKCLFSYFMEEPQFVITFLATAYFTFIGRPFRRNTCRATLIQKRHELIITKEKINDLMSSSL